MKRLRRIRWVGILLLGALAAALFVYSQAALTVGYAVVTPRRGAPPPIATALFTFRNAQDVLVSEAAVAAVEPIQRGRIFVDQRGADTGIAVANPSNQPVVLDLTLRDADGGEIDTVFLTLPAGAHRAQIVNEADLFPNIADDFIGSLTFETRNPDQGVGAVTIRTGQNVQGEPLFATLPVVDLSAGAAAQGAAGSVVFPHIGAGSILSTQIILINRTSQRSAGVIRLTSSNGQALVLDMNGVSASEFPYELEPNGVFFAELTSAEGVQQGYAVVTASQGSLPAGTAVFRFTSGGFAVSEAGVAEIPPTRRARIFVDNNNTQTGVAIANPNDRAVDVIFDLLDRNGIFIEQTTVRLPLGGHTAIFADQLFELPANFTGQIEINALREIVPITLKFTTNQRGDFILTTLPVADFSRTLDADLLIFPQVGFGSAAFGSFFTRLIFINLDEVQPSGGSLAFFSSGSGAPLELPLGGEFDSEFGYEVGAEGARQFFPGVDSQLALIVVDEANLVVNEGETSALRPITLDQEGNARDDFALTFNSLAPATLSVDAQGTMRGLSRGFSTVTISSQGIVVAVSVTVATITGGAQGFEVTGIAQDFGRRVYLSNTRDHIILTGDDVTAPLELWAGRERGPGFVDDGRLQSRFNQPGFIALNQADGSLFVSDSVNHAVRIVRIGADGEVETLAGDGQPGARDGTAAAARFNNPQGLALDAAGNLWVVDSNNHTIRRIRLTDGVVETIAGLAGVAGLADGVGNQARFNSPRGIALEVEPLALQLERALTGDPPPPVTMIVADTGNNVLRRVREDGTVETVDNAGDAPAATKAPQGRRPPVLFNAPEGVVVDEFGNIFVSEPTTRRVRALLRDGQLVQAAQTGTFGAPRGLAVTTRGRVVVAEDLRSAQEIRYAGPSIGEVRPARISAVGGAMVTVTGANFASDTLVVLGGVRIGNASVDDTSTITFRAPNNLPSGRLTLTLQHRGGLDQEFLQVDPLALTAVNPGDVTTVAGGTPFGGDFQLADRASLGAPAGVAFDSEGNLFVADADHNRIRRVDAVTRIITTVLGQGPTRLANPQAVALDAMENLYVADTGNHVVLRVRRGDGSVSRLAGTGNDGFGGDGGPASQAFLSSPAGLAVASNGDVYVADTGNGRIRRIAADGAISSVAEAGDATLTSLQGAALSRPRGIAFDRRDNLYVADEAAHTVWRIDPQGNLEPFAGTGQEGFSGDGGPASTARLSQPVEVAIDSSGNVLIADLGNHRVRRVAAATGIITTAAGTGVGGFGGDGGAALTAALNQPAGLAYNSANDAFVADSGNGRIRRIADLDGSISTYAGNGQIPEVFDGGVAVGAALNFPMAISFDDRGRLLIADSGHHRVRRTFGPSGAAAFVRSLAGAAGTLADALIETVAGNGEAGFSGDGGNPLNASLNQPAGVAFHEEAGTIVADTANHRIRTVLDLQTMSSFFRLSTTSSIDTIAGTGIPGFSGDGGAALGARLNAPHAVASDGRSLYIADRENHRIRRIDLQTGVITTVAGTGQSGFSGDGGAAVNARLNQPLGLALRGQTLLVADSANHRVRRIDLAGGAIATIAGNGTAGFSGDGGRAVSASLNRPGAVAFDSVGDILIGDSGNQRIRRVAAATGNITTLAGVGAARFAGDGGPASEAALSGVGGLGVDSAGNIYFSDSFNHRVRAIRKP